MEATRESLDEPNDDVQVLKYIIIGDKSQARG